MTKKCLWCNAILIKNQTSCEYCGKIFVFPKTNIYFPEKNIYSRPIKHIIGFIGCFIGSYWVFSAPFELSNLIFLLIVFGSFKYLKRQDKGGIALLISIIGFIFALFTH